MAVYLVWSGGNNTLGTEAGGWANAATSISALMTLITSIVSGDIIKVDKTHSYLPGATNTWTLPETGGGIVTVICVDKDNSDAPATGAVEGTTGGFQLVMGTSGVAGLYISGMELRPGVSATSGTADILVNATFATFKCVDCIVNIASNSSTADVNLGASAGSVGAFFTFERCTFKFANAGSGITVSGGISEFINCSIDTAGAAPTLLFDLATQSRIVVRSYGCDWSYATNLVNQAVTGCREIYYYNCVLNNSRASTGTAPVVVTQKVEMHACAPVGASADILEYFYEDSTGIVEDSQATVYLTGGAIGMQSTGDAVPYSLAMTASPNCAKVQPLYTPWVYNLISSTGSKTVTMKVGHDEAAALTTSELFMEIEYMGEPGLAGTQRVTNSAHAWLEYDDDCPLVAGTLGRNVLADGTGRADTAASWAGGFVSRTHTLTATISVDVIGYIRCRVGLAKFANAKVYVDPKINVA